MSQTWKFPPPSKCVCPSLDSQGKHFSYMEAKKQWQHYHQDIMTNLSSVHDRSTVYPFFRVVFQNMHKRTCPCQLSKVFMLKINFTTILFKSNTKFSVILIMHKKTFLLQLLPSTNFQTDNTTKKCILSIFFCLFTFSPFIQQPWSVTCKQWNMIYDAKKLFRRKQQSD